VLKITILYSRDSIKFLEKLVIAWDPDFTKVTPGEAARIDAAEKSGFVFEYDIDWDTIGQ